MEICRNGSWGVICDQGWNNISAALLCQERGFGVGKELVRGFLPDDKLGWLQTSEIRCFYRLYKHCVKIVCMFSEFILVNLLFLLV